MKDNLKDKVTNNYIEPQKPNATKVLIRILLVVISCVMIAFNLNSFVDTGGLYPGGFSGITVLLQRLIKAVVGVSVPYSFIYLPLNLIPVFIGFKYIGKKFTLNSIFVVILTSVLTDIIPSIPITYDVLLISLFGGLINGIAIALCLLAECSSGGTDFISIYYSEKKGISTFNYVLGANIVILLIAAVAFGVDKALYSIIFQFATTQVINLIYKKYEKHTLLIITSQPNVVYGRIKEITNHDATLFKGTGFFEGAERNMVYSVVSSDEVDKVIKAIKEVDEHAFINKIKTEEINGQFFTRPKE